jgi:hypothetical protein
MPALQPEEPDDRMAPVLDTGDDERRAHLRIPAPPVLVEGQWIGVYDIGMGGICLAHAAPLRRGMRVELTVTDGLVYNSHCLTAEVMWCSRGRVGLRWVDLSEEQREWLEERCREWERAALTAQVRRRC